MANEREELLKETVKEMLMAQVEPSETRDNMLEKLIRKFIRADVHKIAEFEPLMHESLRKRFDFEFTAIKFNLL